MLLIEGLRAGHWYDPELIRFVIPKKTQDRWGSWVWTVHVNFGQYNWIKVAYDDEGAAIVAADLMNARIPTPASLR